MKVLFAILGMCFCGSVLASSALADSLAASGAQRAAKGDVAAAKDLFYKALANDENCPEAIFELAKLFDKENNAAAASDFYQRAAVLMGQENKPGTQAKRAEASARLRALNPFAPRMISIFEEYAQDLDKLVKKVPDTITQDAALARVGELRMTNVVTPDKLPKFYAAANAEKVAEKEAEKKPKRPGLIGFDDTPTKAVTKVAPDVERELKGMGWTSITGTWVKKGPNTYEVTDGKLEVAKTNGGIDIWVHKNSSGTVKVAVRNDFGTANETYFSEYTGYGFAVTKRDAKIYVPSSVMGFYSFTGNERRYEPSLYKSEAIPEANPRNHVTMTVAEGTLEWYLNDKKLFRYNETKLPRAGPFVVQVSGTCIIENPRAAGQ